MPKNTENGGVTGAANPSPVTDMPPANKPAGGTNPAESVYSAADLASAARARFGVLPEVVITALRTVGKQKATLTEARLIVKDFIKREVK